MKVDHLFVCSSQQGKEADALVSFGLLEGSNRIHPGQGTRNRKFYFDNTFLEIIWESNAQELQSELVAPTGLWERVNFLSTGCSPFGLCLAHTADLEELFRDSIIYQPEYISEEKAFNIFPHIAKPNLPWMCRVPFTDQKNKWNEPMDHPVGIRQLTGLTYEIPEADFQNALTNALELHTIVSFKPSERQWLTLEFDHGQQAQTYDWEGMPVSLRY